MNSLNKSKFIIAFSLAASALLGATQTHAGGPVPETSVVLVRESEGGGSIKITNTEPTPILLMTSIENIPEDDEKLVLATPPVARVEPGQTQLVRFIMTSSAPLDKERLKRVTFEGIPEVSKGGNTVRMTVRQNLPMLILPKGAKAERAPWTKLTAHVEGGELELRNPSSHVVRLDQTVSVMPGDDSVTLPKSYLLPGESVRAAAKAPLNPSQTTTARIYPATVYGYMVKHHDLSVR
ncbi:fimbria/pilus chaperone family protein [Burkholderia sp. 572]|uniref:fimbria/pilus chaperone family protein n=1 Tax=Burkholderia sp. 572 TaxID=3156414 RepID=UPI003392474B